MDISIRIEADRHADELRSLRTSLTGESDLSNRVRLVSKPIPGKLGGFETLEVLLGAGGAVAVTARATADVLITWLRGRIGTVSITVAKLDGMMLAEYHATSLRDLTPEQAGEAVRALAKELDDGDS